MKVKWRRSHEGCDLPAVVFLSETVEKIVADKKVTAVEIAELHHAVEKVLPIDARKAVVESRKTIERDAKEKKRIKQRAEREAAKQAERDRKERERERRRQERASQPNSFYSKVYGVTQQNDDGTDRQTIIRKHVQPGMTLIVRREPNNPYSEFAISLWAKAKTFGIFETERQIGYVNDSVAEDLAPYLDRGGWARVTVKDVTGGGGRNYGVNIFIEDGRQ